MSPAGSKSPAVELEVGDRTVRTKELPVIFPDDPSAVTLISHLMRW